jgi:hypothetical protein
MNDILYGGRVIKGRVRDLRFGKEAFGLEELCGMNELKKEKESSLLWRVCSADHRGVFKEPKISSHVSGSPGTSGHETERRVPEYSFFVLQCDANMTAPVTGPSQKKK